MHDSVLQDLGVETKSIVVVQAGKKQLALHLFADRHVDPQHIVLRMPDMRRLGVRAGESVSLRPHVPVRQMIRRPFRRRAAPEEKPKAPRTKRRSPGGR